MAKTQTVAQILAAVLQAADLTVTKVTDTEVRVKSIKISVDETGNNPKFVVTANGQVGKARRSAERALRDVQKALKGNVPAPKAERAPKAVRTPRGVKLGTKGVAPQKVRREKGGGGTDLLKGSPAKAAKVLDVAATEPEPEPEVTEEQAFVDYLAGAFSDRVTKVRTTGLRYREGVDTVHLDSRGLTEKDVNLAVREAMQNAGGMHTQGRILFPARDRDSTGSTELYVQKGTNRNAKWFACVALAGKGKRARMEVSFSKLPT